MDGVSKIRVWYDKKRDCYVSNIAFVIGVEKAAAVVACSLDRLKTAGVETIEYEHPKAGVLWKMTL